MKSNIEKDSCEDKMASCEAENGNNVNDKDMFLFLGIDYDYYDVEMIDDTVSSFVG